MTEKAEAEVVEEKTSTQKMTNNLGGTKSLVISFDTTGSMSPCIMQVRQNLRNLVEEMTKDISGLKIGLIAHGDYCDGDNCISILDLTDDLDKIMSFITNAPNTSGGDEPECYELVLDRAKSMSWPEEGGSLVMIGDATPHEVNPNNIDWKEAVSVLKEMNVKVFPLQCLYRPHAQKANLFWEEVSGLSGTPLLMLESFGDSANHLEAMAYAAAGPEMYEAYTAKFASEVSTGKRTMATNNLTSNQTKLDAYVKGSTDETVS